jgi:two-component system chemotaxis response regulator CheB
MQNNKRIRVLVVDDSPLFRAVLAKGIASDPDIEIVAAASDPFDARDRIIEHEPDVMTCDVEMPRMNGIEFIRRLMPQYPIPVVVVSSVSDAVFSAMEAGAVDFVVKPNMGLVREVEVFINELIRKIKIASAANRNQLCKSGVLRDTTGQIKTEQNNMRSAGVAEKSGRVIAIGASTGGTEAISKIIGSLPPDLPGTVIVQHIPPVFSRMFAERLNNSSRLQISEARDGDWLENGRVLIAPGDAHMRLRKSGGRYRVEVFQGEKVNGHCPSVDVLFESIAAECGADAVGIILTGMGYDGAKGLLSMRKNGARTIGQDESSCIVYGMPKVAYNIGAVEKQAALDRIPQLMLSMLR